VKEFWIYTALRAGVFVTTLVTVVGVWMLVSDQVPLLWAIVVAFVVSGLASFFLLNRSREAFARRVQERAERASEAFEARRSKEDVD
jgi:ABC-type bacteriocin/lantibiotic exporter with double-glycine peptidase domain